MAENKFLTIDMIAYETLRLLKNEFVLVKNINTQYNDYFAKKGAKIGDTLTVRNPTSFKVTDGLVATPQQYREQSKTIKVDKVKNVAVEFNSVDLALNMDDFSNRVIKPVINSLSQDVELQIAKLALQVPNSVGTLGSDFKYEDAVNLSAKFTNFAIPHTDRLLAVSPLTKASILKSNVNNFNPNSDISKIWKDAYIGRYSGFNTVESANLQYLSSGSAYTGTVDGASQHGSTLTVSSTTNLVKGNTITIEGVYAVNPVTKQKFGDLRQFLVTEVLDSTHISIYPELDDGQQGGDSFYNQKVNALPINGATITKVEGTDLEGSVNLAYNKDAFTLVTVDLPKLDGQICSVVSDPDSGLSIRVSRGSDFINSTNLMRFDMLYGVNILRDDFAFRVYGK